MIQNFKIQERLRKMKAREIFRHIGNLCREIQQNFEVPIMNCNDLQKQLPISFSIPLSKEQCVELNSQAGVLLTFTILEKQIMMPKAHPYLNIFWSVIPSIYYSQIEQLILNIPSMPGSERKLLDLTDAGYPLFLTSYAQKDQKQFGVIYTPQWIADEMVRLIRFLLDKHFVKNISSVSDVFWYDPAAGMLNFERALLYNKSVLQNSPKKTHDIGYWSDLNPTALVLGYFLMQMNNKTEKTNSNSSGDFILSSTAFHVESALSPDSFEYITTLLKKIQGPIVIMGNPPYSVSSGNRNTWIVDLMRLYSVKEPNITRLYDDYVKFIRLAHKYIEVHGKGIMAFITNRKFLDGKIFFGMRQALLTFFDEIYILDLFGDSRNVKDRNNSENVFGIQTGVCICFFLKINSHQNPLTEASEAEKACKLHYYPLFGKNEEKKTQLQNITLTSSFIQIIPTAPLYLFLPPPASTPWQTLWHASISLPDCFGTSSRAMLTGRDKFMIHVDPGPLEENVQNLAKKNYQFLRKRGRIGIKADALLENPAVYQKFDYNAMKQAIIPIVYRPFDERHTIFYVINHRCGKSIILDHLNRAWFDPDLIDLNNPQLSNHIGFNFVHSMQTPPFNHILISRGVVDSGMFGYSTSKVAPIWYEGRFNLSDNVIRQLKMIKKDASSAELVGYIYGILSCPTLALNFEPFLLHEFPRVVMPCCLEFFTDISAKGTELIQIHLFQFSENTKAAIECQFQELVKIHGEKIITQFQLSSVKYILKNELLLLSGNLDGVSKISLSFSIKKDCWGFKIGSICIISHWILGRKISNLERVWNKSEWYSFFSLIYIVQQTIRIRQKIDHIFHEHESHFIN